MAVNLRPTSLTEQTCDPYVFDTGHFENLLKENSKRTLVPDEELQVKLIETGATGKSVVCSIDTSCADC